MIYYQDAMHTLYHGDAREVLCRGIPQQPTVLLTDPVWPGKRPGFAAGTEDPRGLLRDVCEMLPPSVVRLIIHLGCDCDPRFLQAVPTRFPFIRVCWLRYIRPSYKARCLYTADVAYLFGEVPPSRPGYHLLAAEALSGNKADTINIRGTGHGVKDGWQKLAHPTMRNLAHVVWLVDKLTAPDDVILDPFAGSGTTLLAAGQCGRKSIGIEISEEYCQVVRTRLNQGVLPCE